MSTDTAAGMPQTGEGAAGAAGMVGNEGLRVESLPEAVDPGQFPGIPEPPLGPDDEMPEVKACCEDRPSVSLHERITAIEELNEVLVEKVNVFCSRLGEPRIK